MELKDTEITTDTNNNKAAQGNNDLSFRDCCFRNNETIERHGDIDSQNKEKHGKQRNISQEINNRIVANAFASSDTLNRRNVESVDFRKRIAGNPED